MVNILGNYRIHRFPSQWIPAQEKTDCLALAIVNGINACFLTYLLKK